MFCATSDDDEIRFLKVQISKHPDDVSAWMKLVDAQILLVDKANIADASLVEST